MQNNEDLAKKIGTLNHNLGDLGNGGDLTELLKIIRRPGWTTPAELAFTHAILDAMLGHTAVLTKLRGDLLGAGHKVGTK